VLRVNARLEDVLALVRDWVENEAEPTEVDIGMMLDFLNRLLEVKKLDKLQAVLQTMKM
jgi:DNA repair protein REV1 C-terminal domain